jgi:hypothetical protein
MKMNIYHWWNDTGEGKSKYSEETLTVVTSSTTNLTLTDLGLNPVLRVERPAHRDEFPVTGI